MTFQEIVDIATEWANGAVVESQSVNQDIVGLIEPEADYDAGIVSAILNAMLWAQLAENPLVDTDEPIEIDLSPEETVRYIIAAVRIIDHIEYFTGLRLTILPEEDVAEPE